MMTLVIYDISDDEVRLRVSKVCKRFGLSRIQRSAFLGELTSSKRKELALKLRRTLGGRKGNIQIFIICRSDFAMREIIGKQEFEGDEQDVLIV